MQKDYIFSGAMEIERSSRRTVALLLVLFLLFPALVPAHSVVAIEPGSTIHNIRPDGAACHLSQVCDPIQQRTAALDLGCCGVLCLALLPALLHLDQTSDTSSFITSNIAAPPRSPPFAPFRPPRVAA